MDCEEVLMILSVSRRTDIPSFYMPWFMNRLEEGIVHVYNPMNYKQVREVYFSDVELIVFWTKNPIPFLRRMDDILIPYFIQVSITPYEKDLEHHLPNKKKVIECVQKIASKIGKEKVIWRYDPIIINDQYTIAYHLQKFEHYCKELKESVDHIVISFYQEYASHKKKIIHNHFKENELIEKMIEIAHQSDLVIRSCVSNIKGIEQGACIDPAYIKQYFNLTGFKKDPHQRQGCHCIESIDIGFYGSCINGCAYCYAVKNHSHAQAFYKKQDMNQMILGPQLCGEEKIKRVMNTRQISLF